MILVYGVWAWYRVTLLAYWSTNFGVTAVADTLCWALLNVTEARFVPTTVISPVTRSAAVKLVSVSEYTLAGVWAKPFNSIALLSPRLREISPATMAAAIPVAALIAFIPAASALRSVIVTSTDTVAQLSSVFRISRLTFPFAVTDERVMVARSA